MRKESSGIIKENTGARFKKKKSRKVKQRERDSSGFKGKVLRKKNADARVKKCSLGNQGKRKQKSREL